MAHIYVVGSANIDLNMRITRLPNPGETLHGIAFDRALGGKGANQAVCAARLGGSVTFVAAVGNDSFADECLNAYAQEGIDISLIVRRNTSTGVALITVADDGANTIVLHAGANGLLAASDLEPLRERLQPGDLLLLQLEVPLETVKQAVRLGAECGARVILDPAPAAPLPVDTLEKLFAILPNEHEARTLNPMIGGLNELAEALRGTGIGHVLITAGENGVIWANGGRTHTFPAYQAEAIDTVAAGDAFAGAFAVALAEGWEMEDAIDFGQRAAAISVSRVGAQPSMPTRSEVDSFPAP